MINDFGAIKLSTDDAYTGLLLAAPVFDRNGNLLFAAGTELNEEALKLLDRRYIEIIWVRDPMLSQQAQRILRERVGKRLDYIFRHAEGNEAERVLREKILQFRAGGQT